MQAVRWLHRLSADLSVVFSSLIVEGAWLAEEVNYVLVLAAAGLTMGETLKRRSETKL